MKFKNYIEAQSGIKDSADSPGTLDQVLTSTATGVAWVDPSTISAEAATLVVIECKNTSGAAITKGTPVYQTGTVGATDVIEIAPADALISAGKQPAIGLLQTTLNNNGFGKVVITGEFLNFTTDPIDGVTPTTGDKVFLKSGGGLTLTKPTGAENGIQNLGLIGKVSGGNAGSITVSSIMRTNDVPNLPTGKIWVGDGNTIVSDTVFLDEPNGRMGIGTTSPGAQLHVYSTGNGELEVQRASGALFNVQAQASLATIGTDSNHPLYLKTNAGTRVAITTAGNVGIGTTTPAEKLDVSGRVLANAFRTDVNTSDYSVISRSSAGNAPLYVQSADSNTNQPIAKFFYGNAAPNQGAIVLNVAKDETYFSNTNVGIGTTSPKRKLHVDNSSGVGEAVISGTTGATLYFRPNASYSLAGNFGIFTTGLTSGTYESTMDFKGYYNGVTTPLTIKGSGNVGIGTTSPTADLHVQGSSATDVPIIRSGGFGNSGSKLELAETLAAGGDMTYGFSFFNDGNVSNTLQIKSHNNSTTGVTAMSIGRTNALTTFGTVPIVGTRTAGDNTTYAASTAFVTSAVAGVPIGDYLPLTAGSGSPLTGDLYITKNSPILTITDTVASDLKLEIKQSGSTSNFMSRGGTSSKGQFNFRITDGSTVTNALFINQQANVGIGTTSPSQKLDVNGYARATSGFVGSSGLKLFGDNSSTNFAFVSTGGNVGIGTTSPDARLDVIGRVEIDAYAAQAAGNNAFDSGYLRLIGGAKTGWGIDDELGKIEFYGEDTSGVGARNAASIRAVCETGNGTSTTTFSSGLAFYTSSYNAAEGERLRINNDGNVGIGTTSPAAKLEVYGSAPFIYITDDTETESGIIFRDIQAGLSQAAAIKFSSSDNKLRFYNNDTAAERMTIDTLGNVGIGVTSPSARIHAVYSGLAAKFVSSQATALEVQGGGNSQPIARFKDTSASEKVTISSTGNVGIGTTAPSQKLHVAGNMRLQNQLYDATNSAGTNGQVLTKVSQGTSWRDPAVNAQMPNNTDPASAANVGTIRYRSTSNTSFMDMSMQTGATTYTWVNIVSNFW